MQGHLATRWLEPEYLLSLHTWPFWLSNFRNSGLPYPSACWPPYLRSQFCRSPRFAAKRDDPNDPAEASDSVRTHPKPGT